MHSGHLNILRWSYATDELLGAHADSVRDEPGVKGHHSGERPLPGEAGGLRQVHGDLPWLWVELESQVQRQGCRQVGYLQLAHQERHCSHHRHVQLRQRRHGRHQPLRSLPRRCRLSCGHLIPDLLSCVFASLTLY